MQCCTQYTTSGRVLKHRASSPPVFAWLLLTMNKEIETYWAQPNFRSAGQQRNNLVKVGMGSERSETTTTTRRQSGDEMVVEREVNVETGELELHRHREPENVRVDGQLIQRTSFPPLPASDRKGHKCMEQQFGNDPLIRTR